MTMYEAYEEMKNFLDFGEADVGRLAALQPLFAEHGPAITDRFYETLQQTPATAKFIEGRVDALKRTHRTWMAELFSGDYGEAYFERRRRIGEVHVKIGLSPQFVEGVMSSIRTEGAQLIFSQTSADDAPAHFASLTKILDLDLIVINLAYADERIELMCSVTGMRRKLVENLIRQGSKRKQRGK